MIRRHGPERVQQRLELTTKSKSDKAQSRNKALSKHRVGYLLLCLPVAVMVVLFLSWYAIFSFNNNNNNNPTATAIIAVRVPKQDDTSNRLGRKTPPKQPAASSTATTTAPNLDHAPTALQNTRHHRIWDNNSTETATSIPPWMKDYFDWHAEQRQLLLTAANYKDNNHHKFLVLRCLATTDATCGGASDRLKPLPMLLKLAAESRRIFLIHWSRPCALQEFLVPPVPNGLDWTVPEWMVPDLTLAKVSRLYTKIATVTRGVNRSTPIVCVRIQDQHGGSEPYNAIEGERAYRKVYRSVFYTLFEPSPAVAAAIQTEMQHAGLVPGQYAAAHLRTAYGKHPIPTHQIRRVAANAVNCASQLRAAGPVFFTSDSHEANVAMQRLGQQKQRNIVSLVREKPALHLDKATSTNPADYYDSFVDLFVLAQANGIAHGQGGFGRFGVLLSRNASNFFKFFTGGQYVICEWKDAAADNATTTALWTT